MFVYSFRFLTYNWVFCSQWESASSKVEIFFRTHRRHASIKRAKISGSPAGPASGLSGQPLEVQRKDQARAGEFGPFSLRSGLISVHLLCTS